MGKLPNFNTVTKDDPKHKDLEAIAENPEEFRYQRKRKSRNSPKKLTKNQINENITKFLNGFPVDESDESDVDSSSDDEAMDTPAGNEESSAENQLSNATPSVPENASIQTNL